MKKLYVCLLVFLCMGAEIFATDTVTSNVDYAQETITIAGNCESDEVSIIVLNPNKTLEDMEKEDGAVQNFRKISAEEDGTFSYSFKIHAPEENSGWMTYYIKEDGEEYLNGQIYVASAREIQEIIDDVVTSGIGDHMQEDVFINIFGLLNYDFFTLCDKEKLALRCMQSLTGFQQSEIEEDRKKIEIILKQDSLIEAYEQNLDVTFLDEKGNLAEREYYKLEEYDIAHKINAGEIFDTILSDQGKVKVINTLKGESYKNLEELQQALCQRILLFGLTNAKEVGYDQVEKILTVDNLKFLGMEGTDISDPKLQRAISTSADFISSQELENFINSYQSDIDNDTLPNQNSGGNGGGSRSSKTTGVNGATYDIDSPKDEDEKNRPAFEDLDSVPWAQKAIQALYEKEIFSGKSNKEFDPESYITREEFTKIVVEAFHLEYSEYIVPFKDVDLNQWYAPYVSAACESGVIRGLSETEFGAGKYITRQDLCVMIYRAMKTDRMSQQAEFTDYEQVDEYAREAVNYLTSLQVIRGFEDGSFRPQEPCTRAQTAKIVYEVLRSMEGIS